MAKSSRGGKYVRADGTTTADDGIDRRYSFTRFTNQAQQEAGNDAGQRQEWTPKSRTKYRIVFSDGTPNEIIEATSAKAARAKARTMFGKKKIKKVEEAK